MKSFSKTYLPQTIEYNGELYSRYISCGDINTLTQLESKVKDLKLTGCKVVMCNVLSKNLRGRLDLHNKPYKPTQWIFVTNICNLENSFNV